MRRLVLAAVAILGTVALSFLPSRAQNVVIVGGKGSSASNPLKVQDSTKYADGTYVVTVTDTVHAASLTAKANILTTAESTAVIPCSQYNWFALGFRVIAAGDDTTSTEWAIQVRMHFSTSYDTSLTVPWNSWALPTTAGFVSDSLTTVLKGSGYSIWPGEKLFSFKSGRGQGVLGQGEFGSPDGMGVMLVDRYGNPFRCIGISVRFRCLQARVNYPLAKLMLAMGT